MRAQVEEEGCSGDGVSDSPVAKARWNVCSSARIIPYVKRAGQFSLSS